MQKKALDGFPVCVASGPLICPDAISLGRGESYYAVTFLLAHFKSNFEKLCAELIINKDHLLCSLPILSSGLCNDSGPYERAQVFPQGLTEA